MNYIFILTPQQLAVINAALQELPFKVAAPIFDDLNRQIKEAEKREKPTESPHEGQ